MRRRLVLLTAMLIAAAGATASLLHDRPRELALAPVTIGPAAELVYATGFVEPRHPVTVASQVTAPVAQVLVDEGDRVRTGQPLVRLDDAEPRATLEQTEAEVQRAALDLDRTLKLFRDGWLTRSARDAAIASARSRAAAASAARARLRQFEVRSGIDGVVLKSDVEPGSLAAPGTVLMLLGNPADQWITVTLDERDVPRLKPGDRALLKSDAWPGRLIAGRLVEITPGGDPQQRAFRGRIVPEGVGDLPSGLTMEVNLIIRAKPRALLAPSSAVVGDHVWRVAEGMARRQAVRSGIVGPEKTEILSGVQAGTLLVRDPPADLREGEKIRDAERK